MTPRLPRAIDQGAVPIGGEDDHGHAVRRDQLLRRGQPVQAGHLDVQEYQIRP